MPEKKIKIDDVAIVNRMRKKKYVAIVQTYVKAIYKPVLLSHLINRYEGSIP